MAPLTRGKTVMGDFERELREIRQAKQAQANAEADRVAHIRQEAKEEESRKATRSYQELLERLAKERAFLRNVKPTADKYLQELAKATWTNDFGTDFQDYTDPKRNSDSWIATWEIGKKTIRCGDRNIVVKIGDKDNGAFNKHHSDPIETQNYNLYLERKDGQLYWSPGDKDFPADDNGLRESVRQLAERGPQIRTEYSFNEPTGHKG